MSVSTFVRWKAGEPRESRVFDSLAADHPMAPEPCPACGSLLGDGRQVQLLAIGPGDEEDYQAHDSGRWYTAVAVLFHAQCLGSVEPFPASAVTP